MVKLPISVFISSAMSEMEYDREIVFETVSSMNLSGTMFEMFPSMAESPVKTYLEEVRQSNIFILLLWKTYTKAVEKEYVEALKNSKPILIFIKDVNDGEIRDERLLDFISKLNSARSGEKVKATVYKRYRRLKDLQTFVKDAVSTEIARNYGVPRISQTQQELYTLGKDIVNQSYSRLFIYEKTPCLFLGSRDYLSSEGEKIPYEQEYRNSIVEWIDVNLSKSYTEFLYLFSVDKTRLELSQYKNSTSYIEAVRERIKKYKEIENKSGLRFRFLPIKVTISGFMIVGDIYYAMWFLGESITLSQRNEKISNEIVNLLKRNHDVSRQGMSASYNDILAQLEILP